MSYHNVAQDYYGDDAWNCYYSLIYGNGTSEWGPDAYLTEKGEAAAVNNSKLIKSLLADDFPLPQSFYSSPFTRAADTLVLTWKDLVLDTGYASPIFKESLRETIGLHTCDQRRSKAYLSARYPQFQFEHGFIASETDLLWTKDEQETDEGKFYRARSFLDDVFASDDSTFISATAHSGIIGGLLSAVGHRKFSLATGAIIPVVVKRESRLDFVPVQENNSVTIGPSSTAPTCATAISSTIPSDVAYSTTTANEAKNVFTVTTVVSTTATSN
ncbi:unnamed protein product [Ambrosiozyma monospora]|uniref:Unnamed protein product n=1 Tax=Ambrosiozyma monospora TaxID=43982 RepID=A0A9W6T0H7_AMBMO|nr:unnamed protein product [Ambrosiozyma monospora]